MSKVTTKSRSKLDGLTDDKQKPRDSGAFSLWVRQIPFNGSKPEFSSESLELLAIGMM